MRFIIGKVLEAIVVIVSIIVLGMLAPMMLSIVITSFTECTMDDCFQSVPFWLFSIIGMVASGVYINHVYDQKKCLSNG